MTNVKNIDLDVILALPAEDRLAIADAILTSLEEADDQPLPAWQIRLLRQRIAEDDGDQTVGETWEQFRLRVDHK
jgi:putative addiction module component (TIGR02574 family)